MLLTWGVHGDKLGTGPFGHLGLSRSRSVREASDHVITKVVTIDKSEGCGVPRQAAQRRGTWARTAVEQTAIQ